MKIKFKFIVALGSSALLFSALNIQAADMMDNKHNWNMGSEMPKSDFSGEGKVGIVKGKNIIAAISRNQNTKAKIHKAFTKTSRPCPPFCIQPTHPFAPAKVDTISELDMIYAAKDVANGDKTKLLMDNRTPVWTTAKKGGTIPGAVNIPFNTINSKAIAKDPIKVIDILVKNFDVVEADGYLDFSNAKTLYMFCNGMWCGQSPAGIRALLQLGYPDHKLKYYRGGMNAWHSLGLKTVAK